jgi:uncharacterized membrane protein YheB (UPF0754 family)
VEAGASILADLKAHAWLYLSMPIVAAVIGYVTKLVAIRMMFEPIEFVGLKPPFLGWQGIVPRKARHMAEIACDTMTARLIKPADILAKLDPVRVAEELEKPLLEATEQVTREVAEHYRPGLWDSVPDPLRQRIVSRLQTETPVLVARILEELKVNIEKVFDLKHMVVTNLVRDKKLLNRIFQEAGDAEFEFIARSGIFFGAVLGFVQATTWALTHSPWIMPIFGGLTGWLTDWLALKMIFYPKEPVRILGVLEWQGLFLRRRKEVAAAYGALIAQEIVTPHNVLEAVLRGPLSDALFAIVQKEVERMVDEQAGMAKPIVVLAVGGTKFQEMKEMVAKKVMARLPDTLRHVEEYAGDAMDLRNTLVSKMQDLTADEFEQLLRPIFQQDEWILITVGAVLGFLMGELQVFLMTHH